MIDAHCHLDLYPDIKTVVDGCLSRGMRVISMTTTPSAWRGTSNLVPGDAGVWTALGLHPQLAKERRGELTLFDELLPMVSVIGEVGLDGSPEHKHFWSDQLFVFEHVLQACEQAGGRLISIHSRRASGKVLDVLARHGRAGAFILHWFSGLGREVEVATSLGCWFSVGVPMVRSARGRELIARMPRDHVVTESDGPFVDNGGRPLEPWGVREACEGIARVWQVSVAHVEELMESNFDRMIKEHMRTKG